MKKKFEYKCIYAIISLNYIMASKYIEILTNTSKCKFVGENIQPNAIYNFNLSHKNGGSFVFYTNTGISIQCRFLTLTNKILDELLLGYPLWGYKVTGRYLENISWSSPQNITIKIYLNTSKLHFMKDFNSAAMNDYITQKYVAAQYKSSYSMNSTDNLSLIAPQRELQPINGFGLDLFPYQYNTVMWMLDLERNATIKKIDYTLDLKIP